MRIAGIDPGIGRMGWGVIDEKANTPAVVDFGCLETKKTLTMPDRLFAVHTCVTELFHQYMPDVLSVEELFFNTNTSTAFMVGQARGVVLLTAAQMHVPVISYTPLQVKVAITGYGRAEKKQVGDMVKILLNLSSVPKPDDTADALAVALTHAFSRKVPR